MKYFFIIFPVSSHAREKKKSGAPCVLLLFAFLFLFVSYLQILKVTSASSVQISYLSFTSNVIFASDMIMKKENTCVCEVRQTQWCSSLVCVCVCSQFPVLGLVNLLLYPQSKAAPSHFWNDSHFSHLPLSLRPLFKLLLIYLQVPKAEPRCPTLPPSSFPSSSLLTRPFCRVTVGNRGEIKRKRIHRAAVRNTPFSVHLDSILFLRDVIFLSYCFAIKQ